MKNFIFFAGIAALIWFGWMKVFLDYVPYKQAHEFVEEVRLGVDNGVLRSNFHYAAPMNEDVFVLPKDGIAEGYTLERINEVSVKDGPDSRAQRYRFEFKPSPLARKRHKKSYEYVLLMVDHGSYLMPKYEVDKFLPKDSRKWKKRRRRRTP